MFIGINSKHRIKDNTAENYMEAIYLWITASKSETRELESRKDKLKLLVHKTNNHLYKFLLYTKYN